MTVSPTAIRYAAAVSRRQAAAGSAAGRAAAGESAPALVSRLAAELRRMGVRWVAPRPMHSAANTGYPRLLEFHPC